MKKHSLERRINLRIPTHTLQAIEELRYEGKGKVSYNGWVIQAIQEKIDRASVREESPRATYVDTTRAFYEFFAGGGMARQGLGSDWSCLFANDFDPMKANVYRENWHGAPELLVGDINKLTTRNLPGIADLVWASFPCQDLSLAGKSAGLGDRKDKKQTRSGTFWPFWQLMEKLVAEKRDPKIIVLENVFGALTSNSGKDFAAIGDAFAELGYRFGVLAIDAKLFVPQSRQRIFVVGVHPQLFIESGLTVPQPNFEWHIDAVRTAYTNLTGNAKRHWIWWVLPSPPPRSIGFADLIEENPEGVDWHSAAETSRLLAQMSPLNLKRIEQAKRSGRRYVCGVYRRTRTNEYGEKEQRAEARFDDVAGCLRTPSGGSSRQMILVVEKKCVRSRLLSPREAARLMGLPDTYRLPRNYNNAYHVCGDGVAVPAVRYLADNLLNPLVDTNQPQSLLPLRRVYA